MHIAEAGEGPLVVLLHGFPESWYSWRHQLVALAEAGYRVVAPDQRGYGGTDAPAEIDAYTLLHLVGDVIGLVDTLGESTAVVVGHDWGGPVAWHTAQLRPDVVRGVAVLSVPFRPRGSRPPLELMRTGIGEGYYMVYFQQPGVADAELNADPRRTLRMLLYTASGDSPSRAPIVPPSGGFLDFCDDPDVLPAWLTEADLDAYAQDYAKSGFTGGLNWYRNMDRNWELMADPPAATIDMPAMFIAGTDDPVLAFMRHDRATEVVTGRYREVLIDGAGHWLQQERPDQINEVVLDFLSSLKTGAQPS
jgi:pimeloyl-ACP methyl ester carboxylesterase